MRTILHLLAALTMAAAAVAAAPVLNDGADAADDGPAPTTFLETHVTDTGDGTWDITGAVDFGGEAPVVLGYDSTGDAPGGDAGAALGLDLTEMVAYVPDGDEPVAVLEWHSAGIDLLPPPEAVRFYWQADLGAGGQWAFQAKTSDAASAGNLGDGSPESVAGNVGSYSEAGVPSFRIRGNCGAISLVATSLNNCGHVAWVDGEFDFDDDVVRFFLPLDLPNAAPLRPGATLGPVQDSWAWASFQAGADVGQTRDTIQQFFPYTIPEREASASLVDADGQTVATTTLGVDADSSVSGTLDALGVAPGEYQVVLEACFAENCSTSSTPVTVD